MKIKKLNIISEVFYNKRFYYMDDEYKVYSVSKEAIIPHSPIVSYTKYNTANLFNLIERPDNELLSLFKEEQQPKDLVVYKPKSKSWEDYLLFEMDCPIDKRKTLQKYDGYQKIDNQKLWKQYTCLTCIGSFSGDYTPYYIELKKQFKKKLEE